MVKISPPELKTLLLGAQEVALIDVREQGTFSESHLLFAVSVPLSRLELLIGNLVPRADTPLVVIDESPADDLADRAIMRLKELGYTDTMQLDGGVAAWDAAGLELFSGVNVPSKAFGEFVEQTYETPRLPAAQVNAMLDEGRDMVIVDSRPYEEYHRMNIPGATDMPGAELVLRIHDIAPDPDTLVVVNCAGRTRSIIGAQSLINAGIPNPVVALKDGTMGWHLAGFELEHGSTRQADMPTEQGTKKALAAAAAVKQRFSVPSVTSETVAQWCRDEQQTTYLLDVRSPDEYHAGHLRGYRNAPGGQLVQATDEYVAVKNSHLVLADDSGVRATMTASWLIQMGWKNIYVLDGGISSGASVAGTSPHPILGELAPAAMTTDALADTLETVTVIDLGPSTGFEQHHIPGALWSVRARLSNVLGDLNPTNRIVLTSPDGTLARLALNEARTIAQTDIQALDGGTERWLAEGRATEPGLDNAIGPTNDVWYKPYEHRGAQEKFMRDYLTWEVALVPQIERDGTTRFQVF